MGVHVLIVTVLNEQGETIPDKKTTSMMRPLTFKELTDRFGLSSVGSTDVVREKVWDKPERGKAC